jgi:hypothetical protein
VSGRGDDKESDLPRAPGWYPDPWSATGTGERYFDGKRWGTSERPLARHTTVLSEVRRDRSRKKRAGRFRGSLRTVAVIAALLGVGWGLSRFQHHSTGTTVSLSPASSPPASIPDRPPPGHEEARTPIGTPVAVPAGTGKFEVLEDQTGKPTTPIAWDPCRPIHYVVNPAGAPKDGLALIRSSIARLHTATGFDLIDDGTTTETPNKDRASYQPARYGARWAPVLIAWSDENAFPELAGYIAGIGAPQAVYSPDSDLYVYVTGQVVFDRQQLSVAATPDRGVVHSIILHELGHLAGLDHTADRHEIMFSEAQFNIRDYGVGDLRGLALLGAQACFPDV